MLTENINMARITERQRQLLQAIITEFIETANAVGSVNLSDKYNFKVSPATIRNEMARLVDLGYLAQPHSSSGRVPTTIGLRFFLQELLEDLTELDVYTQTELKQQLHQSRFDKEALVRNAIKFLSSKSGNAAIALVDKDVYYAGLSEILNIPEFQEIENLRQLMVILEDYSTLSQIFNQSRSDQDVKVLIGEETGIETFDKYAIAFSELRLHGGKSGYIAIIGPNRMNYAEIIPAVEYVSKTINRLVSGW